MSMTQKCWPGCTVCPQPFLAKEKKLPSSIDFNFNSGFSVVVYWHFRVFFPEEKDDSIVGTPICSLVGAAAAGPRREGEAAST